MKAYELEEIIEKLTEAYETSTRNFNRFEKAIKSVKWDDVFEADGETYFCIDRLTVMVENLNPFDQKWKPSWMIGTLFREF